jgi:hypothetical protein
MRSSYSGQILAEHYVPVLLLAVNLDNIAVPVYVTVPDTGRD